MTSSGGHYWKSTGFGRNPDRSRDDSHTKGPENVSILHGYLAAALSESG